MKLWINIRNFGFSLLIVSFSFCEIIYSAILLQCWDDFGKVYSKILFTK